MAGPKCDTPLVEFAPREDSMHWGRV